MSMNTALRSEPERHGLPLKAVDMTGRLSGLMLSLSQRQQYRNDSRDTCEFVYTFPLPYGAALLDLRVFLAGRELVGTVIGRQKAEEKYEEAIDEGDAPIMVNQSADGLFTANIGNIKPGEEVTVEVRYAQLLRFEQGHLSLRLPTVIAPRYGEAHAGGGLLHHETDRVDLTAEYPLTLKLEVTGELAQARPSSSSHRISCRADGNSLTVTLPPEARLDRDVVINFDDLTGRSFTLSGPDEGREVVLASFCPAWSDPESTPVPLRLKILVDCSGSMSGDSIEGAKKALRLISTELGPLDAVSYSRFGSSVQHDMLGLTICGPNTLAGLSRLIDRTQASLGGTEMEAALISTFTNIGGSEEDSDLLLITDGEIWDTAAVVKTARESGHRVFAIGVGSAPAESLLRQLAEETGGAGELVSPNDDIKAAVRRQLHRMRGRKAAEAAIDWGVKPVWATALPKHLYEGETIHVFAAFEEPLQHPPRLNWHLNGHSHSLEAGEITAVDNPDLRRLGGRRRLETAGPKEALELALQYQLVSSQTSLFLVHEREAADKSEELPRLRQVEQMLAAGWGGTGSAMHELHRMMRLPERRESCRIMARESVSAYIPRPSSSSGMRRYSLSDPYEDLLEPPARKDSRGPSSGTTVKGLLSVFDLWVWGSLDFAAIVELLEEHTPSGCHQVLADLVENEGLDRITAWALLLSWLSKEGNSEWNSGRQGLRLLRRALAALDESRQKALFERIGSRFRDVIEEDMPF